jgi:hypothetical protein
LPYGILWVNNKVCIENGIFFKDVIQFEDKEFACQIIKKLGKDKVTLYAGYTFTCSQTGAKGGCSETTYKVPFEDRKKLLQELMQPYPFIKITEAKYYSGFQNLSVRVSKC